MFSLSINILDFPNDQVQINPQTKELYYFQGNILNKYKGGITNPVYTFSKDLPGRLIFFTRIGNILCSLENSGEVYLSQNNGQSFNTILTLSNPTSWAMNWACEQIYIPPSLPPTPPKGGYRGEVGGGKSIILLGEYHLDNDNRAIIYISENEGKTWQKLTTIPNQRHIHFIKKDPYSDIIYITIGDNTKDVYITSYPNLIVRELCHNSHLMSVGFHPDYIAFGSDEEQQNFILTIDRNGKTLQYNFQQPRDNMVYDFAYIGKTMISTNRLAENCKQKANNHPNLWIIEQEKAIANIESFYLSNVIDKTCYTGRTSKTICLSVLQPIPKVL